MAFRRQIPLLYTILLVNSVAVSITHFATAPLFLTIGVPALLFAVCIKRLMDWLRAGAAVPSHEKALKMLRGTVVLSTVLGLAFTIWALCLYPYGNTEQHTHVAYYMSLTTIGVVFCLMHLRAAALTLMMAVVPAFVVFFATRGSMVLDAIAINFALVALAMLAVLLTYYRDFANLIASRRELMIQSESARSLSDENFRLANMDSLTGLPNRRRFLSDLDNAVAEASRDGGRFAVGVIDLDGFKPVNDAFGHAIGDKVLMEAGRRLQGFSSDIVMFARLGGDEFGIIVKGSPSDQDLLEFGQAVCAVLRTPCSFAGIVAKVSGSIGFSCYPDSGTRSSDLFERADYALYYAKRFNRGRTTIFSSNHEADLFEQGRIQQALQAADLEKEMRLVYQPIFDTELRRTIGFEALARWTSPQLGPVSPAVFVALAERSGLINQLTETLFRKAVQEASLWPEDIYLSFNLSVHDLSSRGMAERLTEIISASALAADRISFEITESSVMTDRIVARANLDRLIESGCTIALDDFGTGQSNLAYVHQLPLGKVKIDRSFVTGLERNKVSRDLIRTIQALSHNLGCLCIVEGVETAEQVAILRSLGCRFIQGYYYGKPMEGPEALARITGERHIERKAGRRAVP